MNDVIGADLAADFVCGFGVIIGLQIMLLQFFSWWDNDY